MEDGLVIFFNPLVRDLLGAQSLRKALRDTLATVNNNLDAVLSELTVLGADDSVDDPHVRLHLVTSAVSRPPRLPE